MNHERNTHNMKNGHTKYTPAPWHVSTDSLPRVMDDNEQPICLHARLIASAPDLLADLKRAVELLTQVYGADSFIKEAQATINKAEG